MGSDARTGCRTTPLPMENNPRVVFEQMFGDSGSTDPAVRRARMQRDRSILDSVTGRVADLKREVGHADSLEVDEYLEGVRDIERRIERAEQRQDYDVPELAQPEGIPATFAEHVALMFDPQVLAQSDGPDPRDLLHAGARGELGDLHRDRHSRRAPPALPPRVQAGEDRVDVQDQRVSRVEVRRLPGEAPLDAGRRRIAARQHAAPLRVRHVRQQCAQARISRSSSGGARDSSKADVTSTGSPPGHWRWRCLSCCVMAGST